MPTQLHESLADLPATVIQWAERACASLWHCKARKLHHPARVFISTRLPTGELYLGPEKVPCPESFQFGLVEPPSQIEVFHKLWQELEAGADTPEERLTLAFGMLLRLPCGECKKHWEAVLKVTPPITETAEVFSHWVWSRHNDVNQRLGKPFFPFENLTTKSNG